MTVSIITVSYNSAETIRDTIESVARQTYPHIEYIVVDGGSTDGTVDILKENEEVIDRWVSEPDDGIYDAMNKGIRMATGDIIGILNSDDWYEPEAVGTAVRAFQRHPDVGLVHGAMNVWDEDGQLDAQYGKRGGLPAEFVAPFNHPTCFVRRRVYQALGTFSLDLPTAADYEFMLKLLNSEWRDLYVDQALANFRQGGATSRYALSPYSQIIKALRRNEYYWHYIIASLIFRLTRDVVSYISGSLLKRKVRIFIPYHKI